MKRLYVSKDKLVDAVTDFARDQNEDRAEAATRLAALSNRKLLRMAKTAERVKQAGGRDKLAAAVAAAEGRGADADYVAKLMTLTPTMQLDRLDAAEKRGRRARTSKAS
jgi:hypothetical protein